MPNVTHFESSKIFRSDLTARTIEHVFTGWEAWVHEREPESGQSNARVQIGTSNEGSGRRRSSKAPVSSS